MNIRLFGNSEDLRFSVDQRGSFVVGHPQEVEVSVDESLDENELVMLDRMRGAGFSWVISDTSTGVFSDIKKLEELPLVHRESQVLAEVLHQGAGEVLYSGKTPNIAKAFSNTRIGIVCEEHKFSQVNRLLMEVVRNPDVIYSLELVTNQDWESGGGIDFAHFYAGECVFTDDVGISIKRGRGD